MPLTDPVKRKEYLKLYRQSHKEWFTNYGHRYYLSNKARLAAQDKERYQKNRERILGYVKKYADANRDKLAIYQKEYRKRPGKREAHNGYVRKHRTTERSICINHYSNGKLACICCGESMYEFLTIDHMNGGGHKHKVETNGHVYHWLIVNKFPEGYRVLCWNCNCAIGLYGKCPHSKAIELVA